MSETLQPHDGADSMRIDGAGKVVEWRCHYGFDFLGADVPYLMDSPPS